MGLRGPEKYPITGKWDKWMTDPAYGPPKKEGDFVFSPEYNPQQLQDNARKWLISTGFEADLVFEFTANVNEFLRYKSLVNGSSLPHTYTSYYGFFDTGVVQPGQSIILPPLRAGFFHPYYCALHQKHYSERDSETGLFIVYPQINY